MDGYFSAYGALRVEMLQWGHGREAMDGRHSRTLQSRYTRFNGAMAVRPWMGRRPSSWQIGQNSFNGAMAVRPWMVTQCLQISRKPFSFNGAMAVRPWMAAPVRGAGSRGRLLQWGHGREAMDGASSFTFLIRLR